MELNIEKVLQGLRKNDSPYKSDQDNISDAISLIKEFAEEIEDLKAIAEQYQKQFEDCAEGRAKLAEENETLTLKVAAYQVKDKLLSNQLDDKCDMCIARERADTVRKMQERLKAGKFTHKNFGELVYVDDIDQIAKEMLEGER